jgi:hypothetical protein
VTVRLSAAPDLPSCMRPAGSSTRSGKEIIDNAIDARAHRRSRRHSGRTERSHDRRQHHGRRTRCGARHPAQDCSSRSLPTSPGGRALAWASALRDGSCHWHSGEIKVSTEPGRTEFLVTLPLSAERK